MSLLLALTGLSGGASGPTGLATETDTALALASVQRRAIGLATETDTALALAGVQRMAVGLATETDTALALSAGGVAPGTDGDGAAVSTWATRAIQQLVAQRRRQQRDEDELATLDLI